MFCHELGWNKSCIDVKVGAHCTIPWPNVVWYNHLTGQTKGHKFLHISLCGIEVMPQNSRRQTSDMKQVPHRGPKNIRRYRTKFSRPGFVHPSEDVTFERLKP